MKPCARSGSNPNDLRARRCSQIAAYPARSGSPITPSPGWLRCPTSWSICELAGLADCRLPPAVVAKTRLACLCACWLLCLLACLQSSRAYEEKVRENLASRCVVWLFACLLACLLACLQSSRAYEEKVRENSVCRLVCLFACLLACLLACLQSSRAYEEKVRENSVSFGLLACLLACLLA